MKAVGLAVAALLTSATLAVAADAAVGEVAIVDGAHDWSGVYVGIQLGGASSDMGFYIQGAEVRSDHSGDGVIGGAQAGWNFQQGSWVYGVVADISAADINGGTSCPNPNFICSTSIDWLASARVRAGYSFDRVLVFASGGFGFGDVQATTIRPDGLSSYSDGPEVQTGWAAGFGVEFALSTKWSIAGEFLYYDLGDEEFVLGNPTSVDTKISTGRIALNLNF